MKEESKKEKNISQNIENLYFLLKIIFFQQIEFLIRNLELDLRGNHLIKNIRTLLWSSWFFEGECSERWLKVAKRLLRQELEGQVLSDGMHFERSPSYHNDVLSDLLDCYVMLNDEGVKQLLSEKIEKMGQVALSLTHPDESVPLFNDSVITSKRFSDIKKRLKPLGIRLPTHSSLFSFADGGFSGLSLGKDYFVVKHGLITANRLPGHGHADIFSFEWSIEGERLIVDKGVFEYETGERREQSRATKSHNTLNIDGQDQCVMWGSFRSARKPRVTSVVEFKGEEIIVDGSHDGYCRLTGKPIHSRRVVASRNQICVEDSVIGGRGQIAEARLLFHPECRFIKKEESIMIILNNHRVELTSSSPLEIFETRWFPTFGKSIKTHQIILKYGSIPGHWHFRLLRVD